MGMNELARELRVIAKDLSGASDPIFGVDELKDVARRLYQGIKAPLVSISISTLGGKERASMMIAVSLDHKRDWINGIFENSRYFRMDLGRDGELEQFSKSKIDKKFRKRRVKSVDDAISKINRYISQVS